MIRHDNCLTIFHGEGNADAATIVGTAKDSSKGVGQVPVVTIDDTAGNCKPTYNNQTNY